MQAVQLFGAILRLFAYYVLAGLLTNYLIPILGNHSIETIANVNYINQHPELFYTFAWSDMCGKLFGFILLPVLYLTLSKQKDVNPFKQSDHIPFEWTSVFLGIILLILSLPWINVMADWNKGIHLPAVFKQIEENIIRTETLGESVTNLFLQVHSPGGFILSFFAIAIIPAIGEEMVFRGFFQRELYIYTNNIHLSVWIAAFIFSFIHFQFFGFFPRMILGALFGYMMIWTGSFLVPVMMHFANNSLTLILMLAYKNQFITFDPEKSEQIPLLFIFFSLLMSILILNNRKTRYDLLTSSYIKS